MKRKTQAWLSTEIKMDPDKLSKQYYKIKDAAELISVPQSTLRFWEKEFPELKPRRSSTGLRYYSVDDIETLRIIHYLIKIKGLKLDAAKEQLRHNRHNVSRRMEVIRRLETIRSDLEKMLEALKKRK